MMFDLYLEHPPSSPAPEKAVEPEVVAALTEPVNKPVIRQDVKPSAVRNTSYARLSGVEKCMIDDYVAKHYRKQPGEARGETARNRQVFRDFALALGGVDRITQELKAAKSPIHTECYALSDPEHLLPNSPNPRHGTHLAR